MFSFVQSLIASPEKVVRFGQVARILPVPSGKRQRERQRERMLEAAREGDGAKARVERAPAFPAQPVDPRQVVERNGIGILAELEAVAAVALRVVHGADLLEVRLRLAEIGQEEIRDAHRQVRLDQQVVALHGLGPAQHVRGQRERGTVIGAHAFVHPQAEQRRKLLRHVPDGCAQLLRARPCRLDVRRRVALGGDQRGAEGDLHVEFGQRLLRPVGKFAQRAERAPQVRGRLDMRVAPQRPPAGIEPALRRAFGYPAGGIVVRDHLGFVGHDGRELRLEHFGDAAVMRDAAALQQRFVGGILYQRMLEEVPLARAVAGLDR